MKIAFFDTKPYDKPGFETYGKKNKIEFKFFDSMLNEDTVSLAHGMVGVCVFVNDTVNAAVIDRQLKTVDFAPGKTPRLRLETSLKSEKLGYVSKSVYRLTL